MVSPDSMRLDVYISESQGVSRNRAQFFIDQGLIILNGKTAHKASMLIDTNKDQIFIKEDSRAKWVSRSAVKLDDFLKVMHIDVAAAHALDIGSSTGGFTQVLLSRGAQSVTAVDVGTMQLHGRLRGNERIRLFENTDIRDFAKSNSESRFDIIVADVSWCPLIDIIPVALSLLSGKGDMIFLFKPQFEVLPQELTRSGVVRDHERVASILKYSIERYQELFALQVIECLPATLCGEAGNQEYLLWMKQG